MKEYFHVSASEYVEGKNFDVVRPASLNHPKDNAVMFIMSKYSEYIESFRRCRNCLIFWPDSMDVPPELTERHAIVLCKSSRAGYCSFFRDHHITYYPAGSLYRRRSRDRRKLLYRRRSKTGRRDTYWGQCGHQRECGDRSRRPIYGSRSIWQSIDHAAIRGGCY